MIITDKRLAQLSGPDYIRTEAGQIAAQLLSARKSLKAIQGFCRSEISKSEVIQAHAEANGVAPMMVPIAERRGENFGNR